MKKQRFISLLAVLLVAMALTGIALAQLDSGPAVVWQIISGGGGPSSGAPAMGGSVTANDTLGQPFIGLSSGGDITLSAGYWHSQVPTVAGYKIYLPLTIKH